MRIELQSEFSPVQKMLGALMRAMVGTIPGPIQTFSYRKHVFGDTGSTVFHAAMRGKSTWSVAERELFAAFVSKKNSCAY